MEPARIPLRNGPEQRGREGLLDATIGLVSWGAMEFLSGLGKDWEDCMGSNSGFSKYENPERNLNCKVLLGRESAEVKRIDLTGHQNIAPEPIAR